MTISRSPPPSPLSSIDSFTVIILISSIIGFFSFIYYYYFNSNHGRHHRHSSNTDAESEINNNDKKKSKKHNKEQQKKNNNKNNHNNALNSHSATAAGGRKGSHAMSTDVNVGHPLFVASLRGHQGAVHDIKYVIDGHHILSSSEDETIRLWEIKKQHEKNIPYIQYKFKSSDYASALDITDNGLMVAAGLVNKKSIQILDLSHRIDPKDTKGENKKKIFIEGGSFPSPYKTPLSHLFFGPANSIISTTHSSSDTNFYVHSYRGSIIYSHNISQIINLSLTVSPSKRFIAIGNKMTDVKVYEIITNKHNGSGSVAAVAAAAAGGGGGGVGDAITKINHCYSFKGHRSAVGSISFAPNDNWAVTGSADGSIRIWFIGVRYYDGEDPKLIATYDTGIGGPIDHIILPPKESLYPHTSVTSFTAASLLPSMDNIIIAASSGTSIYFILFSNGSIIQSIKNAQKGSIKALRYAPGSHSIASCAEGTNTIAIWKVPTLSETQSNH